MRTRHLLQHVLGCAALALLPAVQAEPGLLAVPAPQPARCQAPPYDGPALLHRKERMTQFEALGEHCLKQLMVECHAAAARQLLDPGSAFACSIGYEALLKRGFGGDFQALLAWWHQREGASGLL
ncbi:hypothetical protein [Ramlibacter sp.]|uniref:hypothetical protein n=1 Tax=Ramlibacter sp. TaxID=1917967 RepID=UPI002D5ABCFB|nr:hypothetical protein [Ramlibacter sp.]HYD75141.1 hypothetical protein [Ramlibacter sp.]